MSTTLRPLVIAITATLSSTPIMADELKPVVISADLRESTEQDIPASVDVKTQADLQDQGATHFDDVLLKTPNVNFSGQSSRARHIQIRGIGERDEYTGAPNSSVGFSIDDIDFSGIGMTGNLFDTKQVEVLRGPQNTRYGQSAIGGLINIQTNDPTATRESMVEATIGQDNHKELGIMTSGPVSSKEDAAQYRIAVFKHNSDGFRTNDTLDRTDTNGRDELTLRGKMRFFPDSDTTVDISLIHADLNNGYDVWSRDNSFTTLSDEPGKDNQLSNAGSIKIQNTQNPNFTITSKTSLANTDSLYSYDTDWIADPSRTVGIYKNEKHRRNFSQDMRIISNEQSKLFNNSTSWLFGLYLSHLEETNKRTERTNYNVLSEIYNTDASSDFTHNKVALYTQLDQALNSKTTLTYSLRLENNQQEFRSSEIKTGTYPYTDPVADKFNPNETLWGASLNYSYKYNNKHTAFAGITRGYKAGGFNTGLNANSSYQSFDSETLYNYEIGLKSNYPEFNLTSKTTFFYMDRQNPQFDGYGFDPVNGNEWVFFTENLDSATNYGLETEFNWLVNHNLDIYGAIGLIQTDVSGNPYNKDFTINGRSQAHAPNYQLNLGLKYRGTNGFYAQSDITALDSFYFDNVHDFKSDAYTTFNARIGYETAKYEIYLWGKNLTDETYATRGFYFDHYDYANTAANYYDPVNAAEYERLGDPRQLGITARVYF